MWMRIVDDCSDVHFRISCANQNPAPVPALQKLLPLQQNQWDGTHQHCSSCTSVQSDHMKTLAAAIWEVPAVTITATGFTLFTEAGMPPPRMAAEHKTWLHHHQRASGSLNCW